MIDTEETSINQNDSQEKPIKEWREKFEAKMLTVTDIIEYFKISALKSFELDTEAEPTRCIYNDAKAKADISETLEEFLFGDNHQEILEKLVSEGNVPSVCGRVFKVGEPTYSCRECGMDPTCVLCVNCFKQSAHRLHKYKMSTSSGGGCCDCGDIEAWKRDQYCDEHIRGKEIKSESSVITEDMKERCQIVFRAIIMNCVKFLELEAVASLECLEGGNDEDLFCTVLYNDESHTFEQVIQTLTKIVHCQQKYAMEYVTSIDREGRAVVKCDTFEACMSLQKAIEKQVMRHSSNSNKYSPLKVSVLHKNPYACQQYSLQLLTWLQEFMSRHMTFRSIFASVISNKNEVYNISHILQYDWKLWKTARSCWHKLLISGMLMEYEHKKTLAIEFSQSYATIIQDFIRDDHDHSISVVSLSVQLFTVPTIAHYLIANEAIFHKMMHTFYWESIEKYIGKGILHFDKNTANLNVFRRAAYILYDIRYILSFKPETWTKELFNGFIEGVKLLLKLLSAMQGMDGVIRQTDQHMDYEPEWESAFNLHIKLANIISSVLAWCSTDKDVLLKVYQLVIKHLFENDFIVGMPACEEQRLAGHQATCLMYDVSSKLVSIHLPLSRFFAGIYLYLGKYDLNFYNAVQTAKRTPEEIIEPVLCTQTMIAQVHSGMWRRNGYSLLHQLFFYRNVRCRSEMLDRDIVTLQIGAALMESNQFLIHVLNKFNLLEWAGPNYELSNRNYSDDDYLRQLNMIDEFLELLIVIIGERYVPGIGEVTEEDRIKKEIIQQLCIKNFSHSELDRALPESNNDTILEDVIDSVAIFKKPSMSDAKGVYTLKKEYFEDYNMYFYHYTKEEKSKSEESQRSRRKNKSQLLCCPPPKLPKLTPSFVSIANLLQCDVMLSLMRTILSRALDLKAKSFTESHLQKVLHLIGYALQEEQSGNYPFLTFYERAVQNDLLQLLEKLTHSARVEAHRDFIIWVVQKFKELQPIANENVTKNEEPLPMTIAETEKQEKEERAKLAAIRREKILAQMANAQKNFIKSNADLFASTSTSLAPNDSMDWQEDYEIEGLVQESQSIACLGVNRKSNQIEEQKFKCILCFEECIVSKDGPCLVYSAFIQKSKVLIGDNNDALPEPHTGTCGHVMHASCWKEYFDSEILKETRRPNRNRSPNNFIVDKKEFLCPYCRCLSNAIIPITPQLSLFASPKVINKNDSVLSFDTWIFIMQDYLEELYIIEKNHDYSEESKDYKTKFPDIDAIIEKYVQLEEFEKIVQTISKNEIPQEWVSFIEIFLSAVQRVSPYPHTAVECEPYLVVWNSCAYTIKSLEIYFQAINKPLKNEMSMRHNSCLLGLIRSCGMLGADMDKRTADKLMIHLRGILEAVLKHKGPSVVEWDVFNLMTSLLFVFTPVLYSAKHKFMVPSGNFFEYYILQLMFFANIAKAIILYTNECCSSMDIDTVEPDDIQETQNNINENHLKNFYKSFNLEIKYRNDIEKDELAKNNIRSLIKHIKDENRTFLRCSCILFHFLTDVEFPDQFCDYNGDKFDIMCKYLGLNPNFIDYFDPTSNYLKSIEQYASHPDLVNYDPITKTKPNGQPLEISPCRTEEPQLVHLPDDYSDLINSVSDFTCPTNDREESRNPTMCLVCGTILCAQSYCCQPELDKISVGACTYHAHYCGADIGIFLRIRDCEILFLGLNKGCFVSPPYLDAYGETDQGLRRGNPLRLCSDRYKKLHLMWLGHSLHEEIARLNESTNPSGVTQWQHM